MRAAFCILLFLILAFGQGNSQTFTDCGGQLTEQSGVITSPKYPDNYPNNTRCNWFITAVDKEIIDLRFSRLDLEGTASNFQWLSDTCPDYVRVYDGDSANSPLIVTMCRIKNSSELANTIIRSTRNKLLVNFVSDYSGQRPGFVATFWTHECPEFKYGLEACNLTCNCARDKTASCNSTNGVCICKKGWGSSDCSQDVDECLNRTVEVCPYDYQECVNTIGSFKCECKAGLILNALGHCEVDPSARCQDGNSCSHLCAKVPIQGQTAQEQCYCPDNMKLMGNTCQPCSNVAFGKDCRLTCPCSANGTDSCDTTTGGCICSPGWTLSNCSKDIDECSELLESVCRNPGEQCVNTPGGYECEDCHFTLTNSSGVIQSPGYPESAMDNANCSWTIRASDSRATISFRFSDFYVNYYDTYREFCYWGALEVYDGSNSNALLLGRYCGSYTNLSRIQSSGDTMYIVFRTRSGVSDRRYFSGVYSTNDYQVSTSNITAQSGNIASPGYPAGLSYSIFKSWTITVAVRNVVTLSFSDYELGECGKDYLDVYDGSHAGANRIGQFCGNKLPKQISSTEKSMLIIYSSEGNTRERGFNGSFIEDACYCYSYTTESCKSPTGPCLCKSGFNGSRCDVDINECLTDPCPAHSSCLNDYGSFSCACWNGTMVTTTGSCDDWNTVLTNQIGSIQSQKYPSYYPRNMNYTWTIIGRPNTVTSFRFSDFNVQPSAKCSYDAVEVYDGGITSGQLIGQYCGKNIPALLRTTGTTMNIALKANRYLYSSDNWRFNGTYYSHECPLFTYGDELCTKPCSCAYETTRLCDNTNGVCFCKPGWVGRGCSQDLDECRNPGVCPRNSDCINEAGNYSCKCHSGYVMNPATGQCQESSSCSEAMRKKCSHLCDVDQVTKKETCICPEDMVLSSDRVTCVASLYPYGLEAADDVVSGKTSSKINNIQVSKPIWFSSEIPLGKSLQSVAYVLYNGVIMFNKMEIVGNPDLKAAHIGSQNLVAPLWLDNKGVGVGEVFYHLYEKCDSSVFAEPGIQSTSSPKENEVMARAVRDIQKYFDLTDFEVSTVLVATWKAVQPKGCQSTTTNTFQAIFVSGHVPGTDRTYLQIQETSFTIFIYKDGEGTCKPGQPFQVGVSTDSGVSPLLIDSKKPTLSNVPGNTGYIGVVTFPVGQTLSASQMCQRYLCKHSDLISSQHFQSEIDELYQCPCSLDRLGLQWQLFREEKNTRCYAISAVAKRRLLQTNQRNRLCCYLGVPSQSDNWQAWSFIPIGHLLISDPWPSSISFGSSPAYQDAEENMRARKWCCNKSSFKFCDRFYKVFGDWQCTTHPTFVPASALGDPYIQTLDRFGYLMNGWGEYILMDVLSEYFTLQARTQRVEINGTLSEGTVFTAFAAREGDYARFQVQLATTNTTMLILANGMDFTNKFHSDTNFSWSTESISVRRRNENNRVVVAATFPCGVSIKVHVGIKSLEIDLEVDKSLRNKTRGLLGNFNGDPNDEFLLPNGTVLPSNLTERQIFESFAKRYLVTANSSVFTYNKGETTENYQHPEFVPTFLDETNPQRMPAAKTLCGNSSKACIYDYFATGSVDFARNTKKGKEAIDLMIQNLDNNPPTIKFVTNVNNNNHWLVYEGKQNSLRVETSDTDGDQVTYELVGDVSGVVLYQNGTISYTPNLQVPVSVGIRAKDSKGAYSPILTIIIVVCPACNHHGQCNINNTQAEYLEGQYQILKCDCHLAYTGANCEAELDACKSFPCSEGQSCTDLTAAEQGNSSEGYRCGPCPAGSTNVNGSCEDINECLESTVCEQECLDTYRSYVCYCRPGFRRDPTDNRACIDINECEERTSTCQQECINTVGNYTCSCKKGYTLSSDGRSCIIDANNSAVCQQCQQVCTVSNGNVFCDCNLGYSIDENNPTRCIDIDECNNGGNSPCSQNCSNTVGKFECSCYPGYRLDIDGVTCLECESPYFGNNCSSICNCQGKGTCDKVRGCVCDEQWSGINCDKDVNECADSQACADGLVCLNEPGSFSCVCPDGYQMENGVCSDIDECAEYANRCDLNVEECYNNVGNYSCRCKEGYTRNAATGICEDINECERQNDGCEHICENGPGSFRCVCHQGYRLAADRHKCEKYKEVCSLNCSHGCSLDDSGVPFCVCPRGYRRGGTNACEDINECASEDENLCGHKDKCNNTVGDYTCSCEPGYRLENDGRSCVACNGGTWGVECNRSCSCGKGAIRCDPVTGCSCKPGSTGEHCTGIIDRCASGELTCQPNEECVIAGGNSVCQCRRGFVWSSGQCQDENECLNARLHNCDQVCINTEGSFSCSCYRGYTYNFSSNTCQDVNECQQGNPCNQSCINTDGSYRCSCQSGQFLQSDGVTCGSCANGCPTTCNCVDSNTDHCDRATGKCTCKEGWTSDDCSVDVDECLQNPCPDYRKCSNLNGSFECVCWNGFQIDSDGTCKDCNRTLTDRTGYLMTSNYPQFYDSNSYCSWTIAINEPDAIIVFSLQDYDVEGCPYDYVEIYDGASSKAPLRRQFCDAYWQTPVTSTGNNMHIVFISDSSVSKKGFRGSYVAELPCKYKTCSHTCSVISSNPWTEKCQCPEWMKLDQPDGLKCVDVNACNTVLTEPVGYIVSSNYPEMYPINFNCHWTIQGNKNSVVTLSFSDFAVEASDACDYDYVKIHDGSSESAPVLGQFCGNTVPPNVTSSGNTMYIIFNSDDSVNDWGFKGNYVIHDMTMPCVVPGGSDETKRE